MLALNNTVDEGQVLGHRLSFNTTSYTNSSKVAAIWLETPLDERIGTRFNDENGLTGRSSAYVKIQIPSPNGTSALLASCAIDARWYQATMQGFGAAQRLSDPLFRTPVMPALERIGQGRPVRLRSNWLNTLTPHLGNSSDDHWNTLSSIITNTGLSNAFGRNYGWSIEWYIGGIVSTAIADGMSRTGFKKNGGNGEKPLPLLPVEPFEDLDEALIHTYGDVEEVLQGT